MGEFINGLKLGTCESLYYTTAKQLQNYSADANDTHSFLKCDSGYRFRFPFPDETHIRIGDFKDYQRGFRFNFPKDIKIEICHSEMFTRIGPSEHFGESAHNEEIGIRFACPFGDVVDESIKVHKWHNDKLIFDVIQQKHTAILGKPQWITTVRCPYCGTASSLDESEILAAYEYILKMSLYSEENRKYFKLHLKIMETALEGYGIPYSDF